MLRRATSAHIVLWLAVAGLFLALPVVAEEAKPAATEPSVAAGSGEEQRAAAAARCQKCGDGYCARSCENEFTCPADCAPQTTASAARCGKCGDGRCVPQCGETATSCPADCGATESSAATNDSTGKCEPSKRAESAQARPDPKRD